MLPFIDSDSLLSISYSASFAIHRSFADGLFSTTANNRYVSIYIYSNQFSLMYRWLISFSLSPPLSYITWYLYLLIRLYSLASFIDIDAGNYCYMAILFQLDNNSILIIIVITVSYSYCILPYPNLHLRQITLHNKFWLTPFSPFLLIVGSSGNVASRN